MRLDGSGQPEDISLGEGKLRAFGVLPLYVRHSQDGSGLAAGDGEKAAGRAAVYRIRADVRQVQGCGGGNNGEQEREEEIPIWQLGVEDDEFLWRIMATTEKGYNVGGANAEHSKGYLRLKMEPVSSILVITHADEFFSVAGGPKKKEQPKTPANRPAKRKKGRKKAVKGRKASRKPLDFSRYM